MRLLTVYWPLITDMGYMILRSDTSILSMTTGAPAPPAVPFLMPQTLSTGGYRILQISFADLTRNSHSISEWCGTLLCRLTAR